MRFVYDPLHYALHHAILWSPPMHFGFARETEFVPVFPAEIRRLSTSLPIVVRRQRGTCRSVALLGENWVNREVMGEDGDWRLPTMPQTLAVHPFRMVLDDTSQERILTVARDRDCVNEQARWPFFDNLAQPTAPVRRMMRRLTILENGLTAFDRSAALLDRMDVLIPLEQPASANVARRSNADFATVDLERFARIDAAELIATGEDLPILMRLVGAMTVSQRKLAAPVLKRLRPVVDNDQLTRSVMDLLTRFEASTGDAVDSGAKRAPAHDLEFLVDDDAVLKFDFTASGSVFRSG
jgi:hypothetical protein